MGPARRMTLAAEALRSVASFLLKAGDVLRRPMPGSGGWGAADN